MTENWRRDTLPGIVAQLATRPGHEAVRVAVTRLITDGLGRQVGAVTHEYRMPLVGGRADALFGATVFEFKSDLRRERADVDAKLPDYLAEHERQTGRRPALGIATDGATFLAFELRAGTLTLLSEHKADPRDPAALLGWLEPAVSDRDDLDPAPLTIARELGRDSLTFRRASGTLDRLWATLRTHPEVRLKRDLWDGLLREAYGAPVGDDALFLQHTYLTIVAKTIALRVLDLDVDGIPAAAILSGAALADLGIRGAVEGDFFDWVLLHPDGADLVARLARQTARFRLRDVQSDVLKALYESLMDPAQRHDLGEYYTPDWLAAKLTARAVEHPLTQRVLDPACGSGTFLFHAIRRLRATAEAAGWPAARRVAACVANVRGLDVHPVAVIIARVTWLLALGDDIHDRPGDLYVPVFLGDALQWNVSTVGDVREVRVAVPDEPPLRVPAGFAEDQARLDAGVQALRDGLARDAKPADVGRDLRRLAGVTAADAVAMTETFDRLQTLYRAGRNGIWPYVLRNLVRPLWLSRPEQRADVLLGNPPWVAFRHLSAPMQRLVKEASQSLKLWAGGVLASQQDLCALFTVRCVDRYLRPGGKVAFVLPYAVLNRPVFKGLRRGDHHDVQIRWEEGWSLDETVWPLFPVPAGVLIGHRALSGPLPEMVRRFTGTLPRRDAGEQEADRVLNVSSRTWPPIPTLSGVSPYRERFKNGATIFPRRFFFVERVSGGRLGTSAQAPLVQGRAGSQDKKPWKNLEPHRGPVEAEFLRPVLLGESLAPFRVLAPALAVVPTTLGGRVLSSAAAESEGFPRLSRWLGDCEAKWAQHGTQDEDGVANLSLVKRLDYQHNLSRQFPIANLRVVYAKAGTLPAAVLVRDGVSAVENTGYWATIRSEEEGHYLCALLNSERIRVQIAPMQPKGQGGARHFDNLMWELPIPEYDARDPLHADLATLAAECERVAAAVPLPEPAYFTTQRGRIRAALAAAGLATRLDALVARLPGL